MLKFGRNKKRLVIPVGINPSYEIDSSTLYNVSDADIVASDVLEGKIGYGKDGKIVGTLDVQSEKEESYQAGIEEQKAKLESITITENGTYNREDGYNEVVVDVPDLNGDYNEGVEDGIEIGKAEIIEGMNDATITAGTVFKGEIGYGKDGERIVGDYESLDFNQLGYSDVDIKNTYNGLNGKITDSKQLYDEWDPNRTSASALYRYKSGLVFAPKIETSNVTDMTNMFSDCYALISVPQFNTSKVTGMLQMFVNCYALISVPLLDAALVRNAHNMFYSCKSLKFLGGLKDLGKSLNGLYKTFNLTSSPLTKESVLNLFNTIYDLNISGVGTHTIQLSTATKALLSDEDIAIATSKGWAVS